VPLGGSGPPESAPRPLLSQLPALIQGVSLSLSANQFPYSRNQKERETGSFLQSCNPLFTGEMRESTPKL